MSFFDEPERALDDLRRNSGRGLSTQSTRDRAAADNLLAKAAREIGRGDDERATYFLRKACEIPYDIHEEGWPGVDQATFAHFQMVADELEYGELGDEMWLDIALRTTRAGAPNVREFLLDDVWVMVFKDRYELDSRLERRVLKEIGERPIDRELPVTPASTIEERIALARAFMEATVAFSEEAEKAYAAMD